MFLSLSTFSFESLFMTEGQQTKYINYVCRRVDELNPPANCLFDKVRLCPECMKEDMNKYGEAYLHRSHHLYGVCPDVNEVIKILSKNLPTLNTYHCDICGNDYCITSSAINNGWNCIYCDENNSIQERYEKLIEKTGEGLYKPISKFEALNKYVITNHTICGEDIEIIPRRFLFENARCKCERIVTLSEVRDTIEKDGEYELISFISGSQPIRVKRKECRHEF